MVLFYQVEIKKLRDEIKEKDRRSQTLAKQLRDFLKANERELNTHAHGMTSTTDSLQHCLDDITSNMLSKVHNIELENLYSIMFI